MNKHIEHLMNQKKSKEEIVKMRAIYEKRIKDFFYRNKFTEEKLRLFETRLNRTFPRFHKK